jgi:hypothetical protein
MHGHMNVKNSLKELNTSIPKQVLVLLHFEMVVSPHRVFRM